MYKPEKEITNLQYFIKKKSGTLVAGRKGNLGEELHGDYEYVGSVEKGKEILKGYGRNGTDLFIKFTEMAVGHNVIEENGKKYMECRGCGKVKELTTNNRGKDANSKTGFLYRCKECMKEVYSKNNVKFYYSHREKILQHHKEYRSLNKEKIRERRRNGREKENIKRMERMKEIVRKNREREKVKGYLPVHRKARYMIRKLGIRPRICPICGWEGKIDAHHPDYNKPYEIVFCCPSCHKLIHNGEICINSENIILLNNK